MGCDIHSCVEVRGADGIWSRTMVGFPNRFYENKVTYEPFDWRSYGMFGFLADVRNYSKVPTIVPERRDCPADASPYVRERFETGCYHSVSWISLAELLEYDYDKTFVDMREVPPETTTLRDFLGEYFFRDLSILNSLGDPKNIRIVFGFDS